MNIIKMLKYISFFVTVSVLISSCSILGNNTDSTDFDVTVKRLIDNGKYRQAAELMSKYGSDSKNDAKTLINIAWMYTFDRQYEDAIKLTDEITMNLPDLQEVYYLRGYIFQKMEKYSSAIDSLKTAIKLNPKDLKSYSLIGEVYQILENYDDAIFYYQQASQIDPKNYIYHLDLANLFFKKADYRTATVEADKAYEFAPTSEKQEINEIQENIRLNAVLNQDINN